MRYRVEHSKINFISLRNHVLSSMYLTLSVFKELLLALFPISCIVLNNFMDFVQVVDVHIFSGIYHSHWRLTYCFSLGIQMHARDMVYIS